MEELKPESPFPPTLTSGDATTYETGKGGASVGPKGGAEPGARAVAT